jgi:hypothetical protein
MLGIMNKVASGTKFTVFILMIVSTHLLFQSRLMLDQFLHSMRKKAVIPINAIAYFRKSFAKLKLALGRVLNCSK